MRSTATPSNCMGCGVNRDTVASKPSCFEPKAVSSSVYLTVRAPSGDVERTTQTFFSVIILMRFSSFTSLPLYIRSDSLRLPSYAMKRSTLLKSIITFLPSTAGTNVVIPSLMSHLPSAPPLSKYAMGVSPTFTVVLPGCIISIAGTVSVTASPFAKLAMPAGVFVEIILSASIHTCAPMAASCLKSPTRVKLFMPVARP